MNMQYKQNIYLPIVFLVAILIRTIGIMRPLLGNFATRAVVYAMIAKNFLADLKTILYPTLNVLVNNKPSLQMTEWPFYSYFVGLIWKFFPQVNIDVLGRLISIAFFALSGLLFYRFCQNLFDKVFAKYVLLFYLFFPLGIIYGQSFQLEASMMFFIMVAFFNIYLWHKGKRSVLRAFCIWFSVSVLLLMKIQMLCLGLPIFVLLVSSREGRAILTKPATYLFGIGCLILPTMWYLHTISVALNYDNVFFSLLYSIKMRTFPDPRIFSLDFYLRIIKTLAKEALSPAGLVLSVVGFFVIAKENFRRKYFVISYILAMVIYFLILPRKIYEMNYYFMPVLIPGAILSAYGMSKIRTNLIRPLIFLIFMLTSFAIAYNPSFTTPDDEKNFILVSEKLNYSIPKEARIIISPPGSPLAFLYYSGREGWSINLFGTNWTAREIKARKELNMEAETDPVRLLEKYRIQGASYYVCNNTSYLKSTNLNFYRYLISRYQLIHDDCYFLIKLLPRKE